MSVKKILIATFLFLLQIFILIDVARNHVAQQVVTTTPTPTSEPSKPNNSETEESSGRPKRSRKTVDKDL